jgi:hypothetical protein
MFRVIEARELYRWEGNRVLELLGSLCKGAHIEGAHDRSRSLQILSTDHRFLLVDNRCFNRLEGLFESLGCWRERLGSSNAVHVVV